MWCQGNRWSSECEVQCEAEAGMGLAGPGVSQGAQLLSSRQAAGSPRSLGETAAWAFWCRTWRGVEEGRDDGRGTAVWEGRCRYLSPGRGSGKKVRAGLERRPGETQGTWWPAGLPEGPSVPFSHPTQPAQTHPLGPSLPCTVHSLHILVPVACDTPLS